MCTIRGTLKNVERKECLHWNQDETLLRPGSVGVAVRLRMLESEKKRMSEEMSWLRRIRGRSRREKVRSEKAREELGVQETVVEKIKKRTPVVWTCGADGGGKTTNCSFTWTCGWKEKQREAKEDLDGQCQGRRKIST